MYVLGAATDFTNAIATIVSHAINETLERFT